MTNEGPRPYTNGDKETRNNRRYDADNHNGVLLGGRISINNHCCGLEQLASMETEESDEVSQSGPWTFMTG